MSEIATKADGKGGLGVRDVYGSGCEDWRVAYYAKNPEELADRLRELDGEWDSSQAAAAASVGMSLASLASAFSRRGRWAVLPITAVQAVLVRHAIAPGGVLGKVAGRCGLRTRRQIESERYALKALRGDFQGLPTTTEARGVAPVLVAVGK